MRELVGSVLLFLGLCILTPLFSLVALLIFWAPASFRYHAIGQWNCSVLFLARWLCGIQHEVIGKENLPKPPYVICSKHQSTWETLAFYKIFPRVSFVVKRSLLWVPFFGWGLWLAMNVIPIDREAKLSAFKKILAAGKKRLLVEKIPVCVFPEGTRMPVGEKRPFMPGACMLAVDSGVPIVPVALNSGKCWPKKNLGFFKKAGKITVSIGSPIKTEDRKTRDVTSEAEKWVFDETARIGG